MSDTRLCPHRLGYVHLKVKNLDESLAFWTRAIPLEISARQGNKVYLRGGMQHHWMVLEQAAEPGLARVALEVGSRAELDAFEAHLKALGIAVQVGDGLETDRLARYLRFADPAGNPLELYCDMVSMPTPPQPRTCSCWTSSMWCWGRRTWARRRLSTGTSWACASRTGWNATCAFCT